MWMKDVSVMIVTKNEVKMVEARAENYGIFVYNVLNSIGGLKMDEPQTLDEWKEIGKHHFELCEKLHNLMDSLPPKIKEEIWDDVYQHFEP